MEFGPRERRGATKMAAAAHRSVRFCSRRTSAPQGNLCADPLTRLRPQRARRARVSATGVQTRYGDGERPKSVAVCSARKERAHWSSEAPFHDCEELRRLGMRWGRWRSSS